MTDIATHLSKKIIKVYIKLFTTFYSQLQARTDSAAYSVKALNYAEKLAQLHSDGVSKVDTLYILETQSNEKSQQFKFDAQFPCGITLRMLKSSDVHSASRSLVLFEMCQK